MSQDINTPLEMFYRWEANNPDQIALRQSLGGGEWQEYTWQQVGNVVRRICTFIDSFNLPKGSNIAIFSSNSADWVMVDLAIMMSGHASVPLYPGQDVKSGRYIMEHSESQLIFLGSFENSARVDEIVDASIPRIAIHNCTCETQYKLSSIIEEYEPRADSPVPGLDDYYTIVYTSGTTGNPKGVVHSHRTAGYVPPLLCNSLSTGVERDDLLSFLPLSHIAERVVLWMRTLHMNCCMSFSAGLDHFAEEMRSVQPTFFFAVPRLWVKFKEGIDANFPPEVQKNFTEEQKAGVRAALGLGNARIIVSGAAAIPKDLLQWYQSIGIDLREGYGMTENFIHGCFAWKGEPVIGSVGHPSPEAEVKITEEGEICFRSDGLMLGYYKNPEKTAEVIRDGWYHSGDRGRLDEDGRLFITGRISEVFKTSKGKFITPNSIEDKLGAYHYFAQLCVFGLGADQPMLLCNLSESARAMPQEEVKAALEGILEEVNGDLAAHERLSHIFVTADEWDIASGLLTPTMKLKRHAIEEHFAPLIAKGADKRGVYFE